MHRAWINEQHRVAFDQENQVLKLCKCFLAHLYSAMKSERKSAPHSKPAGEDEAGASLREQPPVTHLDDSSVRLPDLFIMCWL